MSWVELWDNFITQCWEFFCLALKLSEQSIWKNVTFDKKLQEKKNHALGVSHLFPFVFNLVLFSWGILFKVRDNRKELGIRRERIK